MQSKTCLGAQIKAKLVAGEGIDDDLKVEALKFATQSRECRQRGWVVEDFPNTELQAMSMVSKGVVPTLLFQSDLTLSNSNVGPVFNRLKQSETSLVRDDFLRKFSVTRVEDEEAEKAKVEGEGKAYSPPVSRVTNEPLYSSLLTGVPNARSLEDYYKDIMHNITDVANYFKRNFNNLRVVDARGSTWACVATTRAHLNRARAAMANYVANIQAGKPARIHYIPVTEGHLENNYDTYANYCPVAFADEGLLEEGTDDREFAVEYKKRYYRISSMYRLRKFMRFPDAYASKQNAKALPKDLPFRVSKEDSHRISEVNCEMQGRCPVVFFESRKKGRNIVVNGGPNNIVG